MRNNRTILILIYLLAGLSLSIVGSGTVARADSQVKSTGDAIAEAQLEKLKLEIGELKNKDKEAITIAQLEKLKLEIDSIKNKDSLENKLPLYLPFLSTLVAVSGFIFTVIQYHKGQQKDREAKELEGFIKDQNQIRTNVDELFNLDPEKEASTGKVHFLLEDLNTLVKRRPAESQKVTDSLTEFIRNDCDFDILRHIRIDLAAMDLWSAYQTYLTNNLEAQDFILYKYSQALRQVHDEDAPYFENIQYHKEGFQVKNYTDEKRFLRFMGLVIGYGLHLDLLNDAGKRAEAIQEFEKMVNNSRLTKQLIDAGVFPSANGTPPSNDKPSGSRKDVKMLPR